MSDKCEMLAEELDDGLKTLFQADVDYDNGNRAHALIRLAMQTDKRIDAIKKKAQSLGAPDLIDTEAFKKDIYSVIDMIRDYVPKKEVHKRVMEIDRRWAVRGYRAYASCES